MEMNDMAETVERANIVTRTERARALRPTHAVFKGGSLHALHCKLCGTQIAGLVADDTRTERGVVNGKPVIRERLVFSYFSNYREALLEFDNGSRHVTSVCAECAPKLNDPAVADDAYSMDVSQWVSEGARVRADYASRAGTKLSRVATVIQE